MGPTQQEVTNGLGKQTVPEPNDTSTPVSVTNYRISTQNNDNLVALHVCL